MWYLRPSSIVAVIACASLFVSVAQASLSERLSQLTVRYVYNQTNDQECVKALREMFDENAYQVKNLVAEKPTKALAMSARLFPVNFMNVETMAPMDLLQVDLARRAAVSVSQLRALEALYPIKWDDQQGLLESIERFEDDMKAVVKFTNHLSEKFLAMGEANEAAFEVIKTTCRDFKEIATAMNMSINAQFDACFNQILMIMSVHEDNLAEKRQRELQQQKQKELRLRERGRKVRLDVPAGDYDQIVKMMMDDFLMVDMPATVNSKLRVRKDHRRRPKQSKNAQQ